MKRFVADLHVHSLLSPCAAVEMTPRNIVLHAVEYGIDVIAITDHNAGDNVRATLEAASGKKLTVLLGMEVESSEEIHLLALFENEQQFKLWECYVNEHRHGRLNDENKFGAQFVVDAQDNLVTVKPELLLGSLRVNLAQVTAKVHELGGLCITSHIDRPSYSILSQLGFIPDDALLTAVEITARVTAKQLAAQYPMLAKLPMISSSDAHTMEDFISGAKTIFFMEHVSLKEIEMALKQQELRKVVVLQRWR